MDTEWTALTRPRMPSGVRICTSEWRITTLSRSAAPSTVSAASDTSRFVDTPNTMVATPNTRTAPKKIGPAPCWTGRRASTTDETSAPIAGAARNRPSPHGPVPRMSRA